MPVIASYKRTAFGRLLGGLSSLSAMQLGSQSIRAALESAGIAPSDVDWVVGGQVLQAGQGQNPIRQSGVGAGIGLHVPQITLNGVCVSGMEAVSQGMRLIALGEASVVVCVGQESMSTAPHVLKHSRIGRKYGAMEILDSLEIDGLTDALSNQSMGYQTDLGNAELGISRLEQDSVAVQSHLRAFKNHIFIALEITPITIVSPGGEVTIKTDEGVRERASIESVSALRPAFDSQGSITAANASPISDGAAALVLLSDAEAMRRGVKGIASVESYAVTAGPTTALHSQPSQAILKALQPLGLLADSMAAIEINEAFASVAIQSARDLGVSLDVVNPMGGAIALGHPIGASGARIVGSLALQLARLGPDKYGAAGICGGGGQGAAVILKSL